MSINTHIYLPKIKTFFYETFPPIEDSQIREYNFISINEINITNDLPDGNTLSSLVDSYLDEV